MSASVSSPQKSKSSSQTKFFGRSGLLVVALLVVLGVAGFYGFMSRDSPGDIVEEVPTSDTLMEELGSRFEELGVDPGSAQIVGRHAVLFESGTRGEQCLAVKVDSPEGPFSSVTCNDPEVVREEGLVIQLGYPAGEPSDLTPKEWRLLPEGIVLDSFTVNEENQTLYPRLLVGEGATEPIQVTIDGRTVMLQGL